MKKYFQITKNRIANNIAHRIDQVTITLLIALSAVSSLIMWIAIYDNQKDVNGYDLNGTLQYYLLIPIVGSLTFLNTRFAKEIKEGKFSNYLLKPYKLVPSLFFDTLGKKSVYLSIALPIHLVFVVIIAFVLGINYHIDSVFVGLAFAIFTFFLHFIIDMCITWLAFWIDETWIIFHLKIIILTIFGGMSFPLDFLSGEIKNLFMFLPFKYFYYLPINYFKAESLDFSQILTDFLGLVAWFIFFYFLNKILLKKGLKKYGAFGN